MRDFLYRIATDVAGANMRWWYIEDELFHRRHTALGSAVHDQFLYNMIAVLIAYAFPKMTAQFVQYLEKQVKSPTHIP